MSFLSGIGNFISNAGSSILSSVLQNRENEQARDWQESMSNTAHQREVADLRAAGLNPILSATGGSGASVGSPANQALPQLDIDFGSALALKKTNAEIGQINAEIAKSKSQTELNNAAKVRTAQEVNESVAREGYYKDSATKLAAESFNEMQKTDLIMNQVDEAYQRVGLTRSNKEHAELDYQQKMARYPMELDTLRNMLKQQGIDTERKNRMWEQIDKDPVLRRLIPILDSLLAPLKDTSSIFRNFGGSGNGSRFTY